MNVPNDKIQKQDPGVDIFNMRQPQQGKSASGIKAEPPKQADKGFASKLGPVHFGAAVVIIAVIWIAWPSIFSSSAPSAHVNSSPRLLSPGEAMNDANRARQQSAVRSNAPQASSVQNAPDVAAANNVSASSDNTAASVPPSASVAAEAAASLPAAVPAAAAAQPPAKETELQTKVDELQSKVDELQGKLAQSAAQAANRTVPASKKAAAASAPRVHRIHSTPRRNANTSSASRPSDEPVNPHGFTLNTIYRDQAWIQNAERTYIVQEGDVIDGLRIERVDPNTRQVITSLGIIR